jgi:hypothetical protein
MTNFHRRRLKSLPASSRSSPKTCSQAISEGSFAHSDCRDTLRPAAHFSARGLSNPLGSRLSCKFPVNVRDENSEVSRGLRATK